MPKLIPASTGCPTQNPKTTARATRIFFTLRTSTKMKLAQLRSSRVKRDASFVFGNAACHHFAQARDVDLQIAEVPPVVVDA
jgi:hypothetical protein